MNKPIGAVVLETPVKDVSSAVNGQHYVQCLGCEMPYDTMDGQLLEGPEPSGLPQSKDYCSPCNSVEAMFGTHDIGALANLAEQDLHMQMPRGSKVFRDEPRAEYNLF